MQELQRIYRQALGGHIAAVEGAIAQGGVEGRATILRIAHQLRGSGATYGFREISEAALAVEQADADAFAAAADRLLTLLRATACAE